MKTRNSLVWTFTLAGLPTRKFRTWDSGEFHITEWPYGFVLLKNHTRIGEFPTLELAQAESEKIEAAAYAQVTTRPKLPEVGDYVVATIHIPGNGSMDVRAKAIVVHANGTLRIRYTKRIKKRTKEIITECKTWRYLTGAEKARTADKPGCSQ